MSEENGRTSNIYVIGRLISASRASIVEDYNAIEVLI